MLTEKMFKRLIVAVMFIVAFGAVALAALAVSGVLRSGSGLTAAPKAPEGPTFYELGNKAQYLGVYWPMPGLVVKSPLSVIGQARGWYFEGSFPVELKDANGKILASGVATAQSDWMVDAFVPFIAKLEFSKPATATGTLILKKDNPSGLPEHDDSIALPVKFDLSVK